MAAEKDIIVALELATTAIRAIAGRRMPDGSMQVLAVAEENAFNCIRKGVVDNIDKTTQAISRVTAQIGLQLGYTVTKVYVGLGGQSLHTVLNTVQRPFQDRTQVTNYMIDQLKDTNNGVLYPDSRILDVIPQEYIIGTRSVPDPVGMQVENLEARFLNVIARNTLSENIEKCIKGADLELAEILISPLALSDTLLTAAEKRSGTALVDIGADTTTISIFTNNLLRKLVVLPIGGNNITTDITSKNVEMEEAESLKLRYAQAWNENPENTSMAKVKISYDRTIDENVLRNIIEARYEEIIANVWNQIRDYSDKLTSGIVFTGGSCAAKNLLECFQHYSHCDKQSRIVKNMPTDISTVAGVNLKDNGRMYTIMALLLHGDQNCVKSMEEEIQAVIGGKSEETDTPTKQEAPETQENPENTEKAEKPETPEKKKESKHVMKSFFDKIKNALSEEE